MERAETKEKAPPTRGRLFLIGAVGLLPAIALALAVEAALRALGGEGRVPGGFFVAAAALTPVLAVGLLVQLVTALTRRTRDLMLEVKRFNEEMSADAPRLNEESHRQRQRTWQGTTLFRHALVPFGAGVGLQLVVTELVAIACVAAGTEERVLALALGVEVIALFLYLLFFNVVLSAVTEGRRPASPPLPEVG